MATLLAVAHGTADPAGLAEISQLVELVRQAHPERPVELAWLQRARPAPAEVLARLAGPVVMVPVLLSTGYHVKVDIARLAAERPATVVAPQLGPDPSLAQVLYERLVPGRRRGYDVALFGAGSADPDSHEQLEQAAGQLQALLRAREGGAPRVHPRLLTRPQTWALDRASDPDVASYLLAPGHFQDLLRDKASPALGAGWVAEPLGAHPLVAELIWQRYRRALDPRAGRGAPAGAGCG